MGLVGGKGEVATLAQCVCTGYINLEVVCTVHYPSSSRNPLRLAPPIYDHHHEMIVPYLSSGWLPLRVCSQISDQCHAIVVYYPSSTSHALRLRALIFDRRTLL